MGEQPVIKAEKTDDAYASYMRDMNGPPLDDKDLEFIFDCPDKDTVLEYRNFDPKRLMMVLIERASQSDTPVQFQEEMNNLIAFKRELVKYLRHTSLINLECNPTGWYRTLKQLEKKYDVQPGGMEPDTITRPRLGFMFPHYYMQAVLKTPIYYNGGTSTPPKIPEIFSHPEFAGLIPDEDRLKYSVRRGIISVYIFRQRERKFLSYRTHFLLLKRRIETSQLSNDRRIRFLQTISIIKPNRELAPKTEAALQHVEEQDKIRDDKIEDDVLWNLLN